ncbi:MAG: Slp family lipoprotein [Thioalkalivibrionaceae bacterium]
MRNPSTLTALNRPQRDRRQQHSNPIAALAVVAILALTVGCATSPPYAPITPPPGITLSNETPREVVLRLTGQPPVSINDAAQDAVNEDDGHVMAIPITIADGPAVLWGGVITTASPRGDATIIEIAAYPLSGQTPRLDRLSIGRFRAFIAETIDPIDIPAGRTITVVGPVVAIEPAKVGEATIMMPVVEVDQFRFGPRSQSSPNEFRPAHQRDPRAYDPWAYDPWPYDRWNRHPGPPVRFGIGIGIGL